MVQQICRDVPRRVKGSTAIFFEVHRSESDQTGRCDVLTRFDLGPCKKGFWGAPVCAHWCAHVWSTLGYPRNDLRPNCDSLAREKVRLW